MRAPLIGLVALLVLLVVPAAAATDTAADGGTDTAADAATMRDLQSLIDTTPTGGELVLEPGVYRGGVEVDRSMTIRGSGTAIVDGGGGGTGVLITAPDVTLTGLTIRHTGDSLDRENSGIEANAPRTTLTHNLFQDVLFGIFLRSAADSVVAHNVVGAKDLDPARRGDGIRLWESPRTVIEHNLVHDGRDVVLWFSDDLVVQDNVVTDGRYGLHFMYSDRALVQRNELSSNSVGAFLMYSRDLTLIDNLLAENNGPSGYGIGLKDMDGVTARGNRIIDNRVGIYLDNSPGDVRVHQTFSHNLIAYNEVGVLFLPAVKRNHFTDNAFIDNAEQVGITGSGQFSGNEWTANGIGNYWSDYAGFDAAGDGIGDIPYRLEELYSAVTDNHPNLQFYSQTPAAQAIDLAAQLFPVLRPTPKVEDVAPLVSPPEFAPLSDAELPGPLPLVFGSIAMVLLAGLIIGGGARRGRGSAGWGVPA